MSYNKAIPAASDQLKDSQPELLENFATNSSLIGVDHVISPWTNPATGDQGKHNKVTMPEQAVAPDPGANEMALYTKEQDSVSQLFVRREGPGGTEINITNPSSTLSSNGETTLINGLVVKWGTYTHVPAIADATFTFTFATPFVTSIYFIQLTTVTSASNNNGVFSAFLSTSTKTGGTAYWRRDIGFSSSAPVINYLAIGI